VIQNTRNYGKNKIHGSKWNLSCLKKCSFPVKSWLCLRSAWGSGRQASVPVWTGRCSVSEHPQIVVLHQPHTEKGPGGSCPAQRPQSLQAGLKLGRLAFSSAQGHHYAWPASESSGKIQGTGGNERRRRKVDQSQSYWLLYEMEFHYDFKNYTTIKLIWNTK